MTISRAEFLRHWFRAIAVVAMLVSGAPAFAGNYEYDNYNRALSRDRPGSLGPQSWCCGNIPAGSTPVSAPSSFYTAVKSAFGSMFSAIKALNNKLNGSAFDPTYGATNFNSNLGSMDPNSRGSGVTAW